MHSSSQYYDEGRGERDNPVVVTAYSLEVARQTFFAQVAQSLLVEIEERVPWSARADLAGRRPEGLGRLARPWDASLLVLVAE